MSRQLRTWPKLVGFALIVGGPYLGLRHYEQKLLYTTGTLLARTPKVIELSYNDVWLKPADGEAIHAWFIPATAGDAAGRSAEPHLLFLHDCQGNLGDQLPRLRLFHELGLNVLALDYRGHGRSSGKPSETGLGLDALAGYYELTRKRNVPASHLFIYGVSVGAAVATDLAGKVAAAGLLLEAPFVSSADWLTDRQSQIPWEVVVRDRYETLRKITQARMPILLIHSLDDELIAARHSQRLLMQAGEPKELVALRGKHHDAVAQSADILQPKLVTFTKTPAIEQANATASPRPE